MTNTNYIMIPSLQQPKRNVDYKSLFENFNSVQKMEKYIIGNKLVVLV